MGGTRSLPKVHNKGILRDADVYPRVAYLFQLSLESPNANNKAIPCIELNN